MKTKMGKLEDTVLAITIFLTALVLDYVLYPIMSSFSNMFADEVMKGIYYMGIMGIMILGTVVIPLMYILRPVQQE